MHKRTVQPNEPFVIFDIVIALDDQHCPLLLSLKTAHKSGSGLCILRGNESKEQTMNNVTLEMPYSEVHSP